MRYWVNTVSRDHVERGVAGGFTQANHGKPHMLRRMSRGDGIVFYSPRTSMRDGEPLQEFTAMGRVSDDEVFQAHVSPDFAPFRRRVDFLPAHAAPIRPMIGALDFLGDASRWGMQFRRGAFEVGVDDFRRIAEAMGVNLDALDDHRVGA